MQCRNKHSLISVMSNLLFRVVDYVLYLTETKTAGIKANGDVLFTSETNSVDVRFTSDNSITYSGFYLDIRSALCSDPLNTEEYDDCDDITSEELAIAAGDFLEGALVTDTEDGKYPNPACQNWNIMTDENQVYVFSQKKSPFHTGY